MRHSAILCIPMAGLLAACAQEAPKSTDNPFLVPTSAIVQRTARYDAPMPIQPLSSSDAEYYFPRGERIAYGATSFGDSSNYYTSTYDSQAIGIPGSGGYGYRYRWIIQQGVSSP